MPSGHPDFWQATIPGMPAVGAGQVAWYQSDTDLVSALGTSDLINYVVPDNMELHVCSGVVSCGLPRLQRYDLRQTPAGTWISPTSHIDPDDKWTNEENAYDGVLTSYAYNPYDDYTHYLELLLSSPRYCDKIRIYSGARWGPPEIWVDAEMDIDVYYEGDWHNIFSGAIPRLIWVEKEIGAVKLVSKARVKGTHFEYKTEVYEFQFNTSGTTPQEGIYFDTHAIIPYLPEAPYLVEAGATFAVRVYNDDDAAQNMSVSLAGFLQAKV